MAKPRLLDLFCCGGGAGVGYALAGFEVVGVDIAPQPRYPFEFHQADALTFPLDGFDAIHASPPCQAYSVAAQSQRNAGKEYPDLLAATRARLENMDCPWVIENVPNAPMRADLVLCGSQFGLQVVRHRWFELSWESHLMLMPPCSHDAKAFTVTGHGTTSWDREKRRKRGLPLNPTINEKRASMGCEWMNRTELSQAIPPAYTEFIGKLLMQQIESEAA